MIVLWEWGSGVDGVSRRSGRRLTMKWKDKKLLSTWRLDLRGQMSHKIWSAQ